MRHKNNITSITTPRGTIIIQKIYTDEQEALDNGYGYWFTHKTKDSKRIDIYSKALDANGHRNTFAAVQFNFD